MFYDESVAKDFVLYKYLLNFKATTLNFLHKTPFPIIKTFSNSKFAQNRSND